MGRYKKVLLSAYFFSVISFSFGNGGDTLDLKIREFDFIGKDFNYVKSSLKKISVINDEWDTFGDYEIHQKSINIFYNDFSYILSLLSTNNRIFSFGLYQEDVYAFNKPLQSWGVLTDTAIVNEIIKSYDIISLDTIKISDGRIGSLDLNTFGIYSNNSVNLRFMSFLKNIEKKDTTALLNDLLSYNPVTKLYGYLGLKVLLGDVQVIITKEHLKHLNSLNIELANQLGDDGIYGNEFKDLIKFIDSNIEDIKRVIDSTMK